MSITVRIPTPLRRVTNGQDKVSVEGSNLSEVVGSLDAEFPGLKERLCDEQGEIRNFVNIYVNGEDVRFLQGLDSEIKSGDEISIVPAVAGGVMTPRPCTTRRVRSGGSTGAPRANNRATSCHSSAYSCGCPSFPCCHPWR